MLIDPSDWLKHAAFINEDTAETPLLIDLPQKFNWALDDYLVCHKHSSSRSGLIMPAFSTFFFPGALPWIFWILVPRAFNDTFVVLIACVLQILANWNTPWGGSLAGGVSLTINKYISFTKELIPGQLWGKFFTKNIIVVTAATANRFSPFKVLYYNHDILLDAENRQSGWSRQWSFVLYIRLGTRNWPHNGRKMPKGLSKRGLL